MHKNQFFVMWIQTIFYYQTDGWNTWKHFFIRAPSRGEESEEVDLNKDRFGLNCLCFFNLFILSLSLSLSFFPCDNAHLDLPALHAGSVNCNLILIWINKENPI